MNIFCNNNKNYNLGVFKKNEYGFTLTEIMVVMVLLSVVTSAVYSFYSIGIDTYRNNQGRSETTAAGRFLLKLIEDKIRFKSNDNHNVYMKKNGFASLPANWQNNIFNKDLNIQNIPFYQAMGCSGYPAAGINYSTLEVFIKKLANLGHSYNDEFYGSYVYEITKDGSSVNNNEYKFKFNKMPARVLAVSNLSPLDSAVASSSASADTFEINASALKDISGLCNTGTTGEVEFNITITKAGLAVERLFTFFFSFDSYDAPVFTPVSNIDNGSLVKNFLTGSNLFCDDGMMFWDEDTSGVITNHAFYVFTPDTNEALYDDEGAKLKQIRYITSKKAAGTNVWESIDDVILKNISNIKFSYYDRNLNEITLADNRWQWQSNNKIGSVVIEITTYANARTTTMRLGIDLWIL